MTEAMLLCLLHDKILFFNEALLTIVIF